jgi:hypothetical protein
MCAYTPATGDIFCFPKAADPDDHKHFILAIDGDDALIANFSSFGDEKDPCENVVQIPKNMSLPGRSANSALTSPEKKRP